jgi:hypothetical protein
MKRKYSKDGKKNRTKGEKVKMKHERGVIEFSE